MIGHQRFTEGRTEHRLDGSVCHPPVNGIPLKISRLVATLNDFNFDLELLVLIVPVYNEKILNKFF